MSETLEHLRRRQHTAEALLSVVTTMKGLAAGSIRDYERAAESLQQYASIVDLGFRILLRCQPHSLDHTPSDADHPLSLLILIGSDQGMVGRFNEEIIDYAREHLGGETGRWATHVVAVGQRLGSLLEAKGVHVDACVEQAGSSQAIVRRVQEILGWVRDLLAEDPHPRVQLTHHRPRSKALYEATTRTLLPLDARWLAGLRDQSWPYRGIPSYSFPTNSSPRRFCGSICWSRSSGLWLSHWPPSKANAWRPCTPPRRTYSNASMYSGPTIGSNGRRRLPRNSRSHCGILVLEGDKERDKSG